MNWSLNKIIGSTFKGDFVGRDQYKQTVLPKQTQMDLLENLYKEEKKNQTTTESIIDELTHYSTKKYEIRNLKTKLTEANLETLIDEAEELKQLISMLILKNQNYQSAQKIITILLDDVASLFNSKIKPKIDSEITRAKVEELIAEHLELEIKTVLGENVLEIYRRQIRGMVFFLTGNCHLEWK